MHSHLLAGLDDGVKTLEEAEHLITLFYDLGYRKLVTTPHIISDSYRNTPSIIAENLEILKAHMVSRNVGMELQAAAEYYLDETLLAMLAKNEKLLTLGNNFLLFETNFLTEPLQLNEFIFQATAKGYKLVLAHPERYLYLQNNFTRAQDLLDRGVLFQINLSSVTGYYSKAVQQMAIKLIDRGWVHWLGSDCHHLQHARLMGEALQSKYIRKALALPLLNNSLL
jgi:protein-tyrosine phosphatase